MAGSVDVGTLTVRLAADVDALKKDLAKATGEIQKTNANWSKAFDTFGGDLGRIGEKIGQTGKAFEKAFGDKAPAIMQKFAKDLQTALGLSGAQVKGLSQSVESLEGAFKIAGQGVTFLTSKLGIALGMVISLVAAWGALKQLGDIDVGKGASDWWREVRRMGAGATGDQKALQGIANEQNPGWDVLSNAENARTGKPSGGALENFSAVGAFSESLKSGMEGFAPALEKVMAVLNAAMKPGKSEADTKKEQDEYAKAMKEKAKESHDLLLNAFEANAEHLKALEKEAQEASDYADAVFDLELERQQKAMDDAKKLMDAEQEAAQAMLDADARRLQNAQLFAEGYDISLMKGGANQLGAQLSGSAGPMTSGALTGAVQGFSESGGNGYGALVGAIVSLISNLKVISQVLEGLESVLGIVVGIVDLVLKPLEGLNEAINNLIGSVLSIVGSISGLLGGNGKMGPSEQTFGSEGSTYDIMGIFTGQNLINGIGDAIDWAGDKIKGDTTDAQAEALGAADRLNMGLIDLANATTDANVSMELLANPAYLAATKEAYLAQKEAQYVYDEQQKLWLEEFNAKHGIIDATNDATESFNRLNDALVNSVAGYKASNTIFGASSGIPAMAEGGVVSKPTIALIGESGPEAVIPLDRAGGQGPVNITIQSSDPEQIWKRIRPYLERRTFERTGGAVYAGA